MSAPRHRTPAPRQAACRAVWRGACAERGPLWVPLGGGREEREEGEGGGGGWGGGGEGGGGRGEEGGGGGGEERRGGEKGGGREGEGRGRGGEEGGGGGEGEGGRGGRGGRRGEVTKYAGGGEARYASIPDEAQLVAKCFTGRRDRLTIGEVCRRLTRAGEVTPTGKTVWDRSMVWGM